MKTGIIIFILIFAYDLKGTEQIKDLLIIESDTFFLKTSPLHGTGLDIQYRDTTCFSTGLYRGYWAHWKLENDSLFLTKIISGVFVCSDSKPSEHIVFEKRLFAYWFSNKIQIPIGEELACFRCYYPLYNDYLIIELDQGKVVSKVIQSNLEQVEYFDQLDKVEKIKEALIDSLGSFLSDKLDSSQWNRLDCDWTYIFHFSKKGRLKAVQIEDMEDLYPEDKKCLTILKKAVKDLDLSSFTLPEQDFNIQLEVWHLDGKFDIDR